MRSFLTALLVLVLPAVVRAQDPDSAYFAHGQVCSDNAVIVDQGPSHPQYAEAVTRIWSCSERIELFDDLWADATPVFASRLFSMTKDIRDLRAYQAVMQAMHDGGKPAAVRVAAMGVLGAWLSPGLAPDLGALVPDTIAGVVVMQPWARTSDRMVAQGAQLLPSGAANSIVGAITAIAIGDSDELVQIAAQQLLPLISQGTIPPFNPQLVQLKYFCGNRWMAWNEGDVGGWMFWTVDGTPEAGMVLLPPSDTVIFRTRNAARLRLYFQSTQIRSVPHLNSPCVFGN